MQAINQEASIHVCQVISEDERHSGGWVVCMCMGSPMRDTEQTENHPELSNPGMTI